jgi:TolB protein
MALNGKHRHRLTHDPGFDEGPDVSPNGKKIAFSVDLSNANTDLFVMHPDGTHRKRLTHTASAREFDPTFSPDSRKIAFDQGGDTSDFDIRVMSASGKHLHTLLDGPSGDYPSDWARRR